MSATSNRRLPEWFKVSLKGGRPRSEVRNVLESLQLNTVCEAALCPNLCECWGRRTATFMILGKVCSRNCRFCAIGSAGELLPPDRDEPRRIAEAVARLGLRYAVITSVTRDDLPDGGAEQFAATIDAVRKRNPDTGIEVLTPDFAADRVALERVLRSAPTVLNHNVETCRRLTPEIRSRANYDCSLLLLRRAAEYHSPRPHVKSGFMLGLGESPAEIHEMLTDLRQAGVEFVTIGQYLAPSRDHWPIARFAPPEEFADWERVAREEYGFSFVASGPRVRSSYLADQALTQVADKSG